MTAATTKDSPTTPGADQSTGTDPHRRRLRQPSGQCSAAAFRQRPQTALPPLNGTTGDLHRSCAGCVAFWL